MNSRQAAGQSRAVTLEIHVQPRAGRTEVAGWYGDAIKIRTSAPPVDGAANEALVAFLADRLGISRSSIEIIAGQTSRRKRLRLRGIDTHQVLQRLGLH